MLYKGGADTIMNSVAIKIETGQSLRFENVVAFRKKMKVFDIQNEVNKFVQVLQENGAIKSGPMISVTFGAEMLNGVQALDMQFLVPIDRVINLSEEYQFKPVFHLVNAIYTRYNGNPIHIESVYNELLNFIKINHLVQITSAYNVNISVDEANQNHIIDIYIGISSSLL